MFVKDDQGNEYKIKFAHSPTYYFNYETGWNEQRTSTGCVITGTGEVALVYGFGLATCRPPDQFDRRVGRKLALKRALEQGFPGAENKHIRAAIWKGYFKQTGSKYGEQAEGQAKAV